VYCVIGQCLVCYCECGSPSVPVTAVSWMLSVSAQALHAALYRSIYSLLTWSSLGTLQGFLGVFEKFRRATISFVMSNCPSVRPSTWNNSAPTGRIFTKFHICVIFEVYRKYSNFIKMWQEYQALYIKTQQCHLRLYLTEPFIELEIFHTKYV